MGAELSTGHFSCERPKGHGSGGVNCKYGTFSSKPMGANLSTGPMILFNVCAKYINAHLTWFSLLCVVHLCHLKIFSLEFCIIWMFSFISNYAYLYLANRYLLKVLDIVYWFIWMSDNFWTLAGQFMDTLWTLFIDLCECQTICGQFLDMHCNE